MLVHGGEAMPEKAQVSSLPPIRLRGVNFSETLDPEVVYEPGFPTSNPGSLKHFAEI
jgi:hypothetical protein